MIVADVMTRNVISVAPDATIEQAAATLLGNGISGLFVVDASGDLVGIVTEGDLLRRDELGTGRDRPWWLRMLVSPARQAAEFTRANGRHVRDVMTADVISVPEDASLDSLVSTMEQNRVKRLPVTRDGRVVGVVSRSDLLRALLARTRAQPPAETDDNTIRDLILEALTSKGWAPVNTLNVTVRNGEVELSGTITNDEERNAIRVIAENTRGVKQVRDHLVYVEPYTGTVIDPPGDTPA